MLSDLKVAKTNPWESAYSLIGLQLLVELKQLCLFATQQATDLFPQYVFQSPNVWYLRTYF